MPEAARHGRRSVARVPVVAAVVAAIVVGGLIDRAATPSKVAATAPVEPVPVAAPESALSSSWFCAGATDEPGGPAPGDVVIANSGSTPATGVVTLVPSSGSDVVLPVSVGPDARTTVAENVAHGSPWIGAIVDIDAGAVGVDQAIDSSLGRSSTPCATAGSGTWYFSSGATLINSRVVLSLLNPFPTDAVVDLTFTTNEGVEQPQDFQGLVVPAGGLLYVNLGDHLRRRQYIATTVTARSGRVVAWKTNVVTPPASGSVLVGTPAANNPLADPAAPVAGVTDSLGSPTTGTTWVWPDGVAGNSVDERYIVYNPGTLTANVQLAVLLDEGQAEPFDLTVGPGQVTSVISEQEARIPPGVGHAAILTSTNGVPVVADRTVAAGSSAPWTGLGEMAGQQVDANDWLIPSGAQTNQDEWLSVYNPGKSSVPITVLGLSGGSTKARGSVLVGAGRRWVVQLGEPRTGAAEPLVVDATKPVYVEVNLYGLGGVPGVGLAPGIPLAP